MCGIAGFCLSKMDRKCINSRALSRSLLMRIVKRGMDATGMAWEEDGQVYYAKEDLSAYNFAGAVDMLPRNAHNVILHTRWATKGSPSNNDNNHPIVLPDIVGVHNGHISNDDFLFDLYGFERVAEVDSEVIFHMLTADGDPLESLTFLEGRAAVAWIKVSEPDALHLARLSGSPLAVGTTYGGSLIFASTEELLQDAADRAKVKLDMVWMVPNWTYMKVVDGKIVEMKDILSDEELNTAPISAAI